MCHWQPQPDISQTTHIKEPDTVRVIILKDYETVSKWAAAYVTHRILTYRNNHKKHFTLGLPTGSTPVGMYRELIRNHSEGTVSFKDVVTFNMDEYIGLPEDHPQSYHTFMRENLFDHVDIPAEHCHIPDGNAPDPESECRRYEKRISDSGGIDLFVGGVGSDGHIAFNEPGSSLVSRTRVKKLTRDTIQANSRFFGNDPARVPTSAITVGIGTVMDADEVMLLVTGYNKARALHMGIEEGINHLWTISALQSHKSAIVICDEEATDELKVRTVRYFKEIEGPNLDPDSLLK